MAGGSRAWVDGGAFDLGPLEVCNTFLPPTPPNTYIARTCQQDTMASRGSDGDELTGVLPEKVAPSLAGAELCLIMAGLMLSIAAGGPSCPACK